MTIILPGNDKPKSTCDLETEMLTLAMYLKKYLKKSNTLGKYLNTNTS